MRPGSFAALVAAVLAVGCGGDNPVDPDDAENPSNPDGVASPVGNLSISGTGRIIATYTADRDAPDMFYFGLDGSTPEALLLDAPSNWIELRATASPTDGRIVFQAGWPETQLTTPDDTEEPLVENGPAYQVWAQFTAAGDSVVFAGGEGPGMTSTIWIVSADGGPAREVWSAGGELISPSLSPSGDRLAVVMYERLLVVEVASGEVVDTVEGANVAKFSPVDDRLALIIAGDLYLADADGGNVTLLLQGGEVGFSPRNLAWSPDGEWLVVHEPIAPYAWPGELVLVRAADGYAERLGASEFSQATWAP